jgi:hypothetical protein
MATIVLAKTWNGVKKEYEIVAGQWLCSAVRIQQGKEPRRR